MIKFFLNFEPDIPTLTHQHGIKPFVRKDGKPGMRKTRELESLEYLYRLKLAKFAPPKPITGPVALTTIWYFNGGAKCAACRWRTKKPDTDNLVKTLKDCMTAAGFWKDDAQVCKDCAIKMDLPSDAKHGIVIDIMKLEPNRKGK